MNPSNQAMMEAGIQGIASKMLNAGFGLIGLELLVLAIVLYLRHTGVSRNTARLTQQILQLPVILLWGLWVKYLWGV